MQFNAEIVHSLYQKTQSEKPLIHNITNYVVMQQTANALLAVGASPVMSHAIEEMEEMTGISDALVINIGTLSSSWFDSMQAAMKIAKHRKIPIVFDPVGSGATRFRTEISKKIINEYFPTVIRANASEIGSLFSDGFQTRGVDNTSNSSEILDLAKNACKKFNLIISISGATDYITDGNAVISISNGDNIMSKVTGMGCTATALTAALLTTHESPLIGAATAMALNGIAGELAAAKSSGIGSFQMHYLDILSGLKNEIISQQLCFTADF